LTLVVLVVGLAITAGLALLAATVNDRNESRLLAAEVRQTGTVFATAIPNIETPLASAAVIGTATGGDMNKFDSFMSDYVGAGKSFSYAALCSATSGPPVVAATAGQPGPSTSPPSSHCAFTSDARATPGFSVVGISDHGSRLAYTYVTNGVPRYGVYAEELLPRHRVVIPQSSSFSGLNYAVYLGRSKQSRTLLGATVAQLPLTGRQATATVPFANSALTIVGSPTQPLGGTLSRDLTLIVSVMGALLSLGAAAMTERLVRRRRSAERLATENRRLYGEQQSIAAALQRALLPSELPHVAGMEISSRYVAGYETMEIGGDWYDVIVCDDRRLLFVVGDVSGRGVRAAVVMASLHYAIRAYAAEGDDPSTILSKLCHLLDVTRDGHFATVLCGSLDADRHRITLASAGHLSPLIVRQDQSEFVELDVGPPIGAGVNGPYRSSTIEIPLGCTFLAFTDGLIERRNETIDVGLNRLRTTVAGVDEPLDDLLFTVTDAMALEGPIDDTAVLGLRW
jgi:serine phosphatase RsbU (regulator of sigma subunit)